jgi:hypothetical protein
LMLNFAPQLIRANDENFSSRSAQYFAMKTVSCYCATTGYGWCSR